MTSKELNLKLINMMPCLKNRYKEEISWQEGDNTGSHIVFADVFFPYIVENIKLENINIINECFAVVEKIFDLHDEYADEVVIISILENLSYEDFDFSKIILHMHCKTRQLFENILKKLH